VHKLGGSCYYVGYKSHGPHPFGSIISCHQIYLLFAYHPMGFIGPTKSNPHFVNGFDGNVVTNFAMPILVKFVIFHTHQNICKTSWYFCEKWATNTCIQNFP